MSEAKAQSRAVQFPVLERAEAQRPKALWTSEEAAAVPVRALFNADPGPALPPPSLSPPAPAEPPLSAAPPPPSIPAPPPPTAAATPTPQPPAPELPPIEMTLEERVLSQLPPPPKLGSLIPGARSAPPPANDGGYALMHEHAEAFANAAVELAIARTATLSLLEGQLLDLSIEIASAIIEREVEREPGLHAALARAALASLGDAQGVMLRTSPEAYETICQTLGGAEANVRGVHLQVLADATIPGLGCVVDGDNMRIDATVSERLRAVRRAFEEERRRAAESTE
jgi:hypothetical protein